MANVVNNRILHDGPRNALVKITGILDTSDVSLVPAISPSMFTSNEGERAGLLTGFRVDFVEVSISNGLEILLEWNSQSPEQIYAMTGRGKLDDRFFANIVPDVTKLGYDGSINLKTGGFGSVAQANQGPMYFSVLLTLTKLYS